MIAWGKKKNEYPKEDEFWCSEKKESSKGDEFWPDANAMRKCSLQVCLQEAIAL